MALIAAALIFLAAYSTQIIANADAFVVEVIIWVTRAAFATDYLVKLVLAPQRGWSASLSRERLLQPGNEHLPSRIRSQFRIAFVSL